MKKLIFAFLFLLVSSPAMATTWWVENFGAKEQFYMYVAEKSGESVYFVKIDLKELEFATVVENVQSIGGKKLLETAQSKFVVNKQQIPLMEFRNQLFNCGHQRGTTFRDMLNHVYGMRVVADDPAMNQGFKNEYANFESWAAPALFDGMNAGISGEAPRKVSPKTTHFSTIYLLERMDFEKKGFAAAKKILETSGLVGNLTEAYGGSYSYNTSCRDLPPYGEVNDISLGITLSLDKEGRLLRLQWPDFTSNLQASYEFLEKNRRGIAGSFGISQQLAFFNWLADLTDSRLKKTDVDLNACDGIINFYGKIVRPGDSKNLAFLVDEYLRFKDIDLSQMKF